MNHTEQIQFRIQHQLGITGANAIVADGDDGAADFLLAKLGEQVDLAEHLDAGNFAAGEGGVGIEKAADAMLISSAKDVQHHFAVPASANDDNVHAGVIGPI